MRRSVNLTEARSARPPNTYSNAVRGPAEMAHAIVPMVLRKRARANAKKNRTNQSEGEQLRSDGSQAHPAIQDGLGARASILS